jgi:putative transposase
MRKTFKYRLFPTNAQKRILEQTLDGCCWLYNHFLEQRKTAWETEQKSLSRFGQQKTLSVLKDDYKFLKDIHSQVLQNIAVRIDLAFRAFFRRVKAGEDPGYPRFRGKFRYDSFTYPQAAAFQIHDNKVFFSKIGAIKAKLHRPIEGTVKTCTIRRASTGKWFVSFVCELDEIPVPQPVEPVTGIDMGLENFATHDTGEVIENPRFFRTEEKTLGKAQRKLIAAKKGTSERTKRRKVVARIHERITNKRHNFVYQASRKIIDSYNTICVEDLSINEMKKNGFRGLNKSISDAAWRSFLNILVFKAAWAGKQVIQVNPAYTSQTCSRCGERHKLTLSQRIFHCPSCDLSLHRDQNAAVNILALGMQGVGQALA